MKCVRCGKETPDNLPNCVYCGYVFSSAEIAQNQRNYVNTVNSNKEDKRQDSKSSALESVRRHSQERAQLAEKDAQKQKIIALIVVLAVCVIIAIGAIAFTAIKNHNSLNSFSKEAAQVTTQNQMTTVQDTTEETKQFSSIENRLIGKKYTDVSLMMDTFGEVSIDLIFKKNNKVKIEYSDEVSSKEVDTEYSVSDEVLYVNADIGNNENLGEKVKYEFSEMEDSELIKYNVERDYDNGEVYNGFGFLIEDNSVLSSGSRPKFADEVDEEVYHSDYFSEIYGYPEEYDVSIVFYRDSTDGSNDLDLKIVIPGTSKHYEGYGISDNVIYYKCDDSDSYFVIENKNGKIKAYIYPVEAGDSYNDFVVEEWTKIE